MGRSWSLTPGPSRAHFVSASSFLFPACYGMSSISLLSPSTVTFCLGGKSPWTESPGNSVEVNLSSLRLQVSDSFLNDDKRNYTIGKYFLSYIFKTFGGWRGSSVVEHLSSICKVLGTIPVELYSYLF